MNKTYYFSVSNLLSCLTQVFGYGQNGKIIITGIIAQGIAKGISQHDFDLALTTRTDQIMNSRSEGKNFTPKESWRKLFFWLFRKIFGGKP